jgi:hypothetical protein
VRIVDGYYYINILLDKEMVHILIRTLTGGMLVALPLVEMEREVHMILRKSLTSDLAYQLDLYK